MNLPTQACFQLTHPSPKLALTERIAVLLTLLILPVPARTQEAPPPNEIPAIAKLMDSNVHANSLRCDVHPWTPFLDFNFRFETGVVLSFPMVEINPETKFLAYLRIIPEGMTPVFLKADFALPSPGSNMVVNPDDVYVQNGHLTLSGTFNIGQGRYTVELLVLNKPRSCYKRWVVKTGSYNNRTVPFALEPGAVARLHAIRGMASWTQKEYE